MYSEKTMLFLAAAMQKVLQGKYSYGKKLRSSQSNAFKMMLPARDSKPDYQAMELLISAIEKLVIKNVVIYTEKKNKMAENIVYPNHRKTEINYSVESRYLKVADEAIKKE